MKKLIFFLLGFILITVAPNSFGQYTKVLCIDPGHGGPGGGKYGSNGDGEGASGPHGLTEEWVNLQVGFKLRENAIAYWSYFLLTDV
jgi:N-acetylmuramoyl-L-alanine amidase